MERLPVPPTADAPPDSVHCLEDLLELVAMGRQEEFGELYSRISRKVFGLAKTILRDTGHAEEVTQEVFLELWQQAGSFDRTKGSALSFVMRLTHSRSVDRVRHAHASRIRDGTYSRLEFRPDVDSVMNDVVRHDDRLQLQIAMAGLTTLQREAIALTFLVGHTNRAASVILGIPLPTLKTRVRDGIRALRCAEPSLVT